MIVFDQRSQAQLSYNLAQVPRRVALRHVRIGLNAWGGVVRDKARQNVLEETRLLKKSLAVKVTIPDASRNTKHHGRPARVQVGPSRRTVAPFYRRPGKDRTISLRAATKRALAGKKVLVRKPTRYAHLVERKKPFIGPAQKAGETEGMVKLATKISDGIAAEVAALRK